MLLWDDSHRLNTHGKEWASLTGWTGDQMCIFSSASFSHKHIITLSGNEEHSAIFVPHHNRSYGQTRGWEEQDKLWRGLCAGMSEEGWTADDVIPMSFTECCGTHRSKNLPYVFGWVEIWSLWRPYCMIHIIYCMYSTIELYLHCYKSNTILPLQVITSTKSISEKCPWMSEHLSIWTVPPLL